MVDDYTCSGDHVPITAAKFQGHLLHIRWPAKHIAMPRFFEVTAMVKTCENPWLTLVKNRGQAIFSNFVEPIFHPISSI